AAVAPFVIHQRRADIAAASGVTAITVVPLVIALAFADVECVALVLSCLRVLGDGLGLTARAEGRGGRCVRAWRFIMERARFSLAAGDQTAAEQQYASEAARTHTAFLQCRFVS